MRRRGFFAMILALTMVGLVATAVTAMTVAMRVEAVRTSTGVTDAQMRQLLMAGATDAVERSRGWRGDVEPTEWKLAVPPGVDGVVGGRLVSSDEKSRVVRITAGVEHREARESVRFVRTGGGWVVDSVSPGE